MYIGGSWCTRTANGLTTAGIDWDADNAEIQAALSAAGINATVAGADAETSAVGDAAAAVCVLSTDIGSKAAPAGGAFAVGSAAGGAPPSSMPGQLQRASRLLRQTSGLPTSASAATSR